MKSATFSALLALAPSVLASSLSSASDRGIVGYDYVVSDIKAKGLTSQKIFNSLSNSWMELEHSVCANRAHVWAYDFKRKFGIQPGTIFIFFGEKVWAGQKHKYWYHAGAYIVEDGKELVIEGSYPTEVFKPLSIVEWMDNEMEGAVDASKCVELTKADTDMTERFYQHAFLPNKRSNGKPAYDCYYRKVPAYLPFPEMVAEDDLGKDENGRPVASPLKDFDRDLLISACVDSYTGKRFMRRGSARSFCASYI